ncbi:MAG: hypothetical protein JW395_2068 [Nitrospira sp.]|nr:hypothetical protein [Nitrospira sp.]
MKRFGVTTAALEPSTRSPGKRQKPPEQSLNQATVGCPGLSQQSGTWVRRQVLGWMTSRLSLNWGVVLVAWMRVSWAWWLLTTAGLGDC